MILHGDCIEQMRTLADNSVDAIVTDPPYGWRFMGKAWDGADIERMTKERMKHQQTLGKNGKPRPSPRCAPSESAGKYDGSKAGNQYFMFWTSDWATEALRVLKPGGHMLVFCGPRTYHAMAMGVEMAGFEMRDQLQWLFGSGFPKSHNIGDGWGTALKPANEPIVLARKPLSESTVAKNVLKWGTGAINVDASRIASSAEDREKMRVPVGKIDSGNVNMHRSGERTETFEPNAEGRWPANVLFDESAAEMLDEQSGVSKSATGGNSGSNANPMPWTEENKDRPRGGHADSGGASRFFYVAKTSKRERNAGLEGMPEKITGMSNGAQIHGEGYDRGQDIGLNRVTAKQNHHPTVKPIKLMEYLCRLITPPGGTILDPFMGSGSTGCAAVKLGYQFIGIEREAEYIEIAQRRIAHWQTEAPREETVP